MKSKDNITMAKQLKREYVEGNYIYGEYTEGPDYIIGYLDEDNVWHYYDVPIPIPGKGTANPFGNTESAPRKFRSDWNQRQYDAYQKRNNEAKSRNGLSPDFATLLQQQNQKILGGAGIQMYQHSQRVLGGVGNLLARLQPNNNPVKNTTNLMAFLSDTNPKSRTPKVLQTKVLQTNVLKSVINFQELIENQLELIKQLDIITTYQHGARYYIPWLARWLSCDPINSENYNIEKGNPQRNKERNYTELTASPYEYCYDNPVRFTDPNGEQVPPAKEYKQSAFQKVLNVEHYFAKLIAKVAGGTFTISGFGSVSFGSVRSFSAGKGTDQYENVALFYSKTATETPSVSMNLGAEIGGKIAVLPGYDNVSDLTGRAASFTVSGSLDKIGIPLSAGASLEYNSNEKLVGFGLQLSGGTSLFPVSWSMEITKTYAVIFGKNDYQKFMNIASNIDKIGVSTILNWNRNGTRADNGSPLGFWMYTGGILDYVKAGTDKKGNQLYEAVVNLEFDYRTSGEGARIGVKPVNTTMEVKTNVFFTHNEEGNYISTGFKASK